MSRVSVSLQTAKRLPGLAISLTVSESLSRSLRPLRPPTHSFSQTNCTLRELPKAALESEILSGNDQYCSSPKSGDIVSPRLKVSLSKLQPSPGRHTVYRITVSTSRTSRSVSLLCPCSSSSLLCRSSTFLSSVSVSISRLLIRRNQSKTSHSHQLST